MSNKQSALRMGIEITEYEENTGRGLKRCSKCKQWKPFSCFSSFKSDKLGLNHCCKSCTNGWPTDERPPRKSEKVRSADDPFAVYLCDKYLPRLQGMLSKIVKHSYYRGVVIQELESVAADALLNCSMVWVHGKGTKFSSYLYKAIEHRVSNEVRNRRAKGRQHIVSLNDCSDDKKGEYKTFADAISAEDVGNASCYIEVCNRIDFEHCLELIDRLDPINKDVFLKTQFYGYTYEEVAAALGISKERVRQRIKRARDRMMKWAEVKKWI